MCGCEVSNIPSAPPIGGIKKTKKQKQKVEPVSEPKPEDFGIDSQYIRDQLLRARNFYLHKHGYIMGNSIIKRYPSQLIDMCFGLEVFTKEVISDILVQNKSNLARILPLLELIAKCRSNPAMSENIDTITTIVRNGGVNISNDDVLLTLYSYFNLRNSDIYEAGVNILTFPKFIAKYIYIQHSRLPAGITGSGRPGQCHKRNGRIMFFKWSRSYIDSKFSQLY